MTAEGTGNKREYWVPQRDSARKGAATHRPPKEAMAATVQGTPPPAPASTPQHLFRAGRNVLAVQVAPDSSLGDVFFRFRLDELRKPTVATEAAEEVLQKQVTDRAVVCDLCSSLPGQVPACVNACPHDAALRIDARSEFPGA